jgi:hypothetical protein
MGLCNSKVADDEVPQTSPPPKAAGGGPSSEAKEAALSDFRETLKTVTILVLNRLATALEYEKEGFSELAAKLEMKNYMQLAAPQHFEAVIKETWDIDRCPPEKADVPADHMSFAQNKFIKLLEAAEKAEWRDPSISAQELTDRIQEAAKQTQKTLRDSAIASNSSDLKIHLFFFAKCLDVVDGEIATHFELLYSNIDDLTEPK